VGGEVAVGSFLVNYLTQSHIGALSPKTASFYVSLYWGGSMAGRFPGAAVMRLFPASKVLGTAAIIVVTLLVTSVLSSGLLAMWSILLVGLFNSIMFPTIFTLGIANLGPLTGKGSGVLMSAAVGGAIIPVVQGAFADRMGVHPWGSILHSSCLPSVTLTLYFTDSWAAEYPYLPLKRHLKRKMSTVLLTVF
jgi:FHS family L-fucose permease-like MFS transporter